MASNIILHTSTLQYTGEKSADITNCDSDATCQPIDITTDASNLKGREGKRRSARSQARKTENDLALQGM